jgi:3-hydroxyacyl-CoA dehydrogenase/enoyl-CoA hydratase/3-hydroxybutyryl-CoA epimerase
MGKTVIVVRDHPGFWVNRILTPYLNEAGRLLSEGTGIELIDRTMTRFGFPVGPVALLDEVGLDVASKAGKVMHQAFGARLEPVDVVSTMIADNRYGRKNGRGFYHYHEGHKTGVDDTVYDLLGVRPGQRYASDVIEDRLVYAMLNEAALAVSDGVVRLPRDGDIGAIFGIGFPPFRGGPLRMLDDLGAGKVVERLTDLAAAFGERFRPAPALVEMGRTPDRQPPGRVGRAVGVSGIGWRRYLAAGTTGWLSDQTYAATDRTCSSLMVPPPRGGIGMPLLETSLLMPPRTWVTISG